MTSLNSEKRVLIATHNKGKAREFAEMFEGWKVETLHNLPDAPEVVENGKTFEANARKKAVEISKIYPGKVLADDSGLEVDILDGAPGVFSARYGSEPKSDARNLKKLLQELEGVSEKKRGAQFRCVLALAERGKVLSIAEGICRGKIAFIPQGDHGFGYDPVFIPEGYEQTFGELSSEIKNNMSHRGKAMQQLLDYLKIC